MVSHSPAFQFGDEQLPLEWVPQPLASPSYGSQATPRCLVSFGEGAGRAGGQRPLIPPQHLVGHRFDPTPTLARSSSQHRPLAAAFLTHVFQSGFQIDFLKKKKNQTKEPLQGPDKFSVLSVYTPLSCLAARGFVYKPACKKQSREKHLPRGVQLIITRLRGALLRNSYRHHLPKTTFTCAPCSPPPPTPERH